MNHYNDSPQNKQNAATSMAEKTREEEVYLQVNTEQVNSQLSEAAPEEALYTGVVRKDTLVISEEGRLASTRMCQQGERMNTVSDSNSTARTLQEESSEETEAQTEDLSEYTDTELKQMYHRGEITLQEYEDETGEIIE